MAEAEIVFEKLHLHRIPLEHVEYSSSRVLRIAVDLAEGGRVTFMFSGVVGLRCEDTEMQEILYRDVNAPRYDTLLRVIDSRWLCELRKSYQITSHKLSDDTAHYVLVFDDYTWEILARTCAVQSSNVDA